MKELTQETLKALLHYDPETGIFSWAKSRRGIQIGAPVGTDAGNGYIKIGVGGALHYAHRLAWFYVHGKWPSGMLDHVNRNRADNRISNLREASLSENGQNRYMQRNNTSGYRGVSWDRPHGKWQAKINVNKKSRHLGYFDQPDDAYAAYVAAASELHTHNPHAEPLTSQSKLIESGPIR